MRNVLSVILFGVVLLWLGLALPALLVRSWLGARPETPWSWWAILAMFAPGAFFALINSGLCLRYYVWRWRGGRSKFQYNSGLPVIGTIATMIAVGIAWGDPRAVVIGAALCALDVGGLTWCLISVTAMSIKSWRLKELSKTS